MVYRLGGASRGGAGIGPDVGEVGRREAGFDSAVSALSRCRGGKWGGGCGHVGGGGRRRGEDLWERWERGFWADGAAGGEGRPQVGPTAVTGEERGVGGRWLGLGLGPPVVLERGGMWAAQKEKGGGKRKGN